MGTDHQMLSAKGATVRKEGLTPKLSGISLSGHKWEREKRNGAGKGGGFDLSKSTKLLN